MAGREPEDGDDLACGGPCLGNDEDAETMAFVGDRHGDYVKEVSYRWVGDGQGIYNRAEPPKRRSAFGCLCLLGSLAVFGGIVYLNGGSESPAPEPGQAAARSAPASESAAAAHFECDARALHPGDVIQAAFDIAFRPQGFVTQGSVGTVDGLLPTDDGRLIVTWKGYSQLQGSKVSRSQVLRVLKEGDFVETLEPVTVAPPERKDDLLNVDDMVLAANNIDGHIPQGSFGYVSKARMVSGAESYQVSFPELPEFSGLQVGRADIVKAPSAGDRVRAVVDINVGVLGTITKGTLGNVLSMSRDKATYAYQVQWTGYPQQVQAVRIPGINLEIVTDASQPAAVIIPKGTRGQVASTEAQSLADAKLGVFFKDFLRDRVMLQRSQVVKSPDWADEQRQYCCRTAEVGCGAASAAAPDPFTCLATPQASLDEKSWCCEHKRIGCPEAAGGLAARQLTALRATR